MEKQTEPINKQIEYHEEDVENGSFGNAGKDLNK